MEDDFGLKEIRKIDPPSRTHWLPTIKTNIRTYIYTYYVCAGNNNSGTLVVVGEQGRLLSSSSSLYGNWNRMISTYRAIKLNGYL